MGTTNTTQLIRRIGPRLLLSLILLLPQQVFSLDIDLPDMGDPADALMTPAAEKRLGRAFIRNLQQRERFVEEAVFEEYIETLGNKLANQSDDPGRHFRFYLIENPVVNAFAAPDGHIGVYTGLVLTSQSESELASVLAHEIAHVTQKHLFRTFYRAQNMSMPAAMALLAAVLIGVGGGNAQFGQAAVAGIQAGMIQDQINYTRHNEEEADRVGMDILSRSKFDPRAMPAFFKRMGRANQSFSTRLPEFLRTHPVTTNRIADALGRAGKYPYKQYKENIRYHLLRAWLRYRSFNRPSKAVTHFKDSLAKGRYRNKDAQEYGYALALTKTKNYSQAHSILSRLLKNKPHIVEYRLALAQLESKRGNKSTASRLIKEGRRLQPNSKALALGYVDLMQQQGSYKTAASVISKLIRRYPTDPRLYLKLSRAEGKSGKRADAHAHLAEHYYLQGQLKSATRQLEIALREPSLNDYQSAKFAARLKTIKREYIELEKLRKKR